MNTVKNFEESPPAAGGEGPKRYYQTLRFWMISISIHVLIISAFWSNIYYDPSNWSTITGSDYLILFSVTLLSIILSFHTGKCEVKPRWYKNRGFAALVLIMALVMPFSLVYWMQLSSRSSLISETHRRLSNKIYVRFFILENILKDYELAVKQREHKNAIKMKQSYLDARQDLIIFIDPDVRGDFSSKREESTLKLEAFDKRFEQLNARAAELEMTGTTGETELTNLEKSELEQLE